MAADARLGPLRSHVDSVLDELRVAGYAPPALTSRRWILNAFIRWIGVTCRKVEDLTEADVTAS